MKRGQAALEFLTTYGWSFVVMMTVVGAVSFFGITNPTLFIPEQCQFSTDIQCKDFMITTITIPSFADPVGMVLIDVKQTTGRTAYIKDFSCEDSLGGQVLSYYQEGTDYTNVTEDLPFADTDLKQWDPGIRVTLKCFISPNPFILKGESVRIPLTITMRTREGGFNHEVQGELIGKIQ